MRLLLFLVSSVCLAAEPAKDYRGLFKPLPKSFDSAANPTTAEKVALGKALFTDVKLSAAKDVSCNSCHDLTKYGVDGLATSTGHKGQKGGRNAPTVYNAGLGFAQFWDGRAATLEDQAKGPVLNPIEMAMPDAAAVEKVLQANPAYAPMFKKAFPADKQPITFDNFARAVAAFERTLVTPSRFDRYLAGDAKALTAEEQAGLAKFVETGCTVCHNGVGVGAGMYQKYGLAKPVEGLKDEGRFQVTKLEADRFVFKVPSLRNVEKTGPWLHDGSAKTLEEVVALMGRHQLNRELSADEVKSLVVFLKALTGKPE